jgi:hypothetical protein
MNGPRNPAGMAIAFLALLTITFTSISYGATWWRVQTEVQSVGSSSAFSEGNGITAKFYISNVVMEQNGNAAPSVEYGNILGMEYHDFNCIKGITIALIFLSCVTFLFGIGASAKPEKLARTGKLFAFLSFAGFALGLTTLFLTADVPNEAGDSFSGLTSGDVTFPTFSCQGSTLSWGTFSGTGSSFSCSDIWDKNDYTDSTTSTVVEFKTKAGAGWWWMFGATLAFAILTKLSLMASIVHIDNHVIDEKPSEVVNESEVELNQAEPPLVEKEAPMVNPEEPPMLNEVTA